MNLKKLGAVLIVTALLFSFFSCTKSEQEKPKKKVEIKVENKFDCGVFTPPWGYGYWEDWGKANPDKFEPWYVSVITKMAKISGDEVEACSHLDNFFIGFSKFKNLEAFSRMTHLKMLDMRFSQEIKDLKPISNAKELEFLSIWKTGVTDLTPIVKLPKLKRIDAKMTALEDISMLKDMKQLESIDLLQTKVKDISVFKDLPNIKEILLCSTQVKDISVIYPKADQITYIDLCNTQFKDFESLRKFKNLKRLKLWGLPITDASLFSEMKDLYELDLWNTKIKDLSPLFKLKKLKRLVVVGLKVDKNQLDTLKKNNPGIEIVEKL